MFNLDVSKTYWWPVTFRTPGADGGKLEDMSFTVEFRRYSTDEVEEMMKRAEKDRLSDAKLAREIVVNWRDVIGAGGVMAFSEPNFAKLLKVSGAGSAIMKAFFESLSKGAEKN